MLRTTLLGLALIVLLLVVGLGRLVARQAGNGTADGTSSPVRDARPQVAELAASLLLLALEVLLATGLLEGLDKHTLATAHQS